MKSLFFARIYKIMAEFSFAMGSFKQALADIYQTEQCINMLMLTDSNELIFQELQCLKFENKVLYAKIMINLGHLQEAETETEAIVKEYE